MRIKEKILESLSREEYKPKTKEQLALDLGIDIKDYRLFFNTLKEMEKEDLISVTKKDKIIKSESSNLYQGIIRGSGESYSYFSPYEQKTDFFIPGQNLKGAVHNDEVIVKVVEPGNDGELPVARVVRIVHRERNTVVGVFERSKSFGFVRLDDPKYGFDVFIRKGNFNGAKNDDKVVVKLISTQTKKNTSPEGVVVNVLGNKDEIGMDITSIIHKNNLPDEFPKKVIEKARLLPKEVMKSDKKGRTDFTNILTVTIDGKDAKDFDDAISIKKEDNHYTLYVHIADVDHYVKKGSALDKEAYRRATSVYLLDRVLPMLPRELSNGICSLNPEVERLALTVKMEINAKGKVLDYKFYESVIRSDFRLVYDDVSDYLEGTFNNQFPEQLQDNLKIMEELFLILKAKREKRGSIDFDFDESEIILNDKEEAVDIRKFQRRVANRIIEEFMILTNETVATHFAFMQQPFLYRIHEEPDEKKVEAFKKLISVFGYALKGKKLHPKDYQQLLLECKGKPEESLISLLLLRSMKKAIYHEEQDMHFGLASMFYTHFTSPIRRYPDLFIHRITKAFIEQKEITSNEKEFGKYTRIVAEYCSNREQRAEDSEREVDDMKCAEYMMNHIGEQYDGIISSLTDFGIFVRLDNTIEGLCAFNLMDDFFVFDEKNYIVRGERSGIIYNIGQKVRIEVINASKEKRQIDFKLVGE